MSPPTPVEYVKSTFERVFLTVFTTGLLVITTIYYITFIYKIKLKKQTNICPCFIHFNNCKNEAREKISTEIRCFKNYV